jgi:flagellar biosynthesis/type III secretory pathway protein FliH
LRNDDWIGTENPSVRDFREWATHRREEAPQLREEAPQLSEEAPQLREEATQLSESRGYKPQITQMAQIVLIKIAASG